jgi:hypothetical protein
MTEFDNTDRGVLYRNENKTSENHPDYSGSVNVAGTDFWLSGWLKESKKDQRHAYKDYSALLQVDPTLLR